MTEERRRKWTEGDGEAKEGEMKAKARWMWRRGLWKWEKTDGEADGETLTEDLVQLTKVKILGRGGKAVRGDGKADSGADGGADGGTKGKSAVSNGEKHLLRLFISILYLFYLHFIFHSSTLWIERKWKEICLGSYLRKTKQDDIN